MINAFAEIVSYSGPEWDDFLDKRSLLEIFKPVLQRYSDNSIRKGVINYIIKAYTLESQDIVIGMEWQRNKKIIFEKCMLPYDMHDELVLFENIHDCDAGDFEDKIEKDKDITAIRHSITKWLTFQDSQTFVQLSVLKDLQIEMQISANTFIKKSSGENDYDQKFKNAKYAMDLRVLIRTVEDELIQNNEKLKEAVQEVRKGKVKSTMGIESFIK